MTTYLTIFHYLAIAIVILLFVLTVIVSMREQRTNVRTSMIASSFIVMLMLGAFFIMALDKYTKKAEIRSLKNTRVLMTEEIIYNGYAANVGDFTIGEVKLEIKLVNKGHVTGNVKGGSFYKPSGFWDFFGGNYMSESKDRPQSVIKTFVVARDLEPGKSRYFTVRLPYPPYFTHTSQYTRVFAH